MILVTVKLGTLVNAIFEVIKGTKIFKTLTDEIQRVSVSSHCVSRQKARACVLSAFREFVICSVRLSTIPGQSTRKENAILCARIQIFEFSR